MNIKKYIFQFILLFTMASLVVFGYRYYCKAKNNHIKTEVIAMDEEESVELTPETK